MSRLSESCKRGTSYRTVFKNIALFADGLIKELYPSKTRQERIIIAQDEPWFTACREDRGLTEDELKQVKNHSVEG